MIKVGVDYELEFDSSNTEFENTEEIFNFNQAFSEGEEEEGYTPLDNIEDNYVGIEEEPYA
ncbi:MAG: hypothetical protein Q8844_02665 [Pigeon pea little leaf phytoplasma]|nr:hypothetical protein [Pigeon pea little leaf phytoplasma]